MNPEVESIRAKITQTSTDGQLQTTMDSLGGSQDRRNSGDVGLRPTTTARPNSEVRRRPAPAYLPRIARSDAGGDEGSGRAA